MDEIKCSKSNCELLYNMSTEELDFSEYKIVEPETIVHIESEEPPQPKVITPEEYERWANENWPVL
jgi:hypothetical protein